MKQNRALFQFKPFSKKQKKILTWWLPASPANQCNGIIADGAIRVIIFCDMGNAVF